MLLAAAFVSMPEEKNTTLYARRLLARQHTKYRLARERRSNSQQDHQQSGPFGSLCVTTRWLWRDIL